MRTTFTEGRYIVSALVVIFATLLYGVGLVANLETTPVEPQSVFTLYGAVLGYLFGSHEKQQDQVNEVEKEERQA